jgi:hypothetical protein
VSQDDQPTREQGAVDASEQARAEARAAELRSELAATDARRAEEETARAHDAVVEAEKAEQKKEAAEREAEQRAQQASQEAYDVRRQAEYAAGTRNEAAQPGSVRALPPGSPPALTERPEVMAGAAFAGAFLVARILKRIFD